MAGYSPALSCGPNNSSVPLIHLGGERHCESRVSCPKTRYSDPGQSSNPLDRSIRSPAHLPLGHRASPQDKVEFCFLDNFVLLQWLKEFYCSLTDTFVLLAVGKWRNSGQKFGQQLLRFPLYLESETKNNHLSQLFVTERIQEGTASCVTHDPWNDNGLSQELLTQSRKLLRDPQNFRLW